MNASIWSMGWALALLVSGSVKATDVSTATTLHVQQGWIRAAPPVAPVRAGYARLENQGKSVVRIDAAHSDAFGAIEIHEMHEVEGVMRMRRVPQLQIQPQESAVLEPGGLHLMLFRPTAPLHEGARVRIVFSHEGQAVAEGEFHVGEWADS